MAIVFTYAVATNTVTVTGGTSGTPATFADFVTADRAGTGTSLRAATAGTATVTLTYPVRPVELRAIVVKCVVAAKTAQADFIFITGTDAWDAAQTESIDVTAGNGTYTTTKRWRTITNIDCSDNSAGGGTIWADGTLAVTQDIWGVIWDLGNGNYQIDCLTLFGDGSTATYFQEKDKSITFTYDDGVYISKVKSNCTVVFGQVDDATDKVTSHGCSLIFSNPTADSHAFYGDWSTTACLELYSCIAKRQVYANAVYIDPYKNTAFNCMSIDVGIGSRTGFSENSFFNITLMGTNFLPLTMGGTMDKIKSLGTSYGYFTQGAAGETVSNLLVINPTVSYVGFWVISADVNIIDIDTNGEPITFNFWGACTGNANLKYTIQIHIADKNGVDLSGATITCVDNSSVQQFSVNTGIDGKIADQIVLRGYYNDAGGNTIIDSSPHKFTISKAGYQTLVLDNITIDAPIKWHLELQNTMHNNFSHMGRMNS